MPYIVGILLCFLSIVSALESDVLELSDVDFEAKLDDKDLALVMFYAPWCGHCKRLKPEFEKAAGDLLREEPPVTLAKVDCTEKGEGKCKEFGVSGYPTLKIFRNGKLSQEYNGPREAGGIKKYMKSLAGPSVTELRSESDLNTFVGKDDIAVVGFFWQETDLQKVFYDLAGSLREDLRFGRVMPDLKMTGYENDVVLYRPKQLHNKFENEKERYAGAAEKNALKKFLEESYSGLAGVRDSDNQKYFVSDNSMVVYFNVDYTKNPKGTNYWRNRVLKVVSQYQSELSAKKTKVSISNFADFHHELDNFGITFSKDDKPHVGILAQGGKLKYAMKEDFSLETFEQFVKDWLAGKLESYVKSEPVPEGSAAKDGEVLVAVAKNFDEVVNQRNRDTLIEFYAPWCGHCKKLTPIYKELAEDLKDEEVDIVKMDATANDVPPIFDVTGFPTLYWVPKNSKNSPKKYQSGREKDDFIEFIAKEATEELKGYNRKGKKLSKTEL